MILAFPRQQARQRLLFSTLLSVEKSALWGEISTLEQARPPGLRAVDGLALGGMNRLAPTG